MILCIVILICDYLIVEYEVDQLVCHCLDIHDLTIFCFRYIGTAIPKIPRYPRSNSKTDTCDIRNTHVELCFVYHGI